MKDHLKKKWTLVHQEFKSKSKPKVPTQAAPSTSAGAASAGKSQPSIRLPYIPGGKHSYTQDDDLRDMMIEKFIIKLQTPVSDTAPSYDKSQLAKAVDIAIALELEIHEMNRGFEKPRKDKFRSLISVFVQHSHMREKLMSGAVGPKQILHMKREDFLGAELKRQLSEADEARMQSMRTDWAREQDQKAGLADSFFTCKKCKSKKTSYYQQQTRGADEPMTNFIECLDCGFKWKE